MENLVHLHSITAVLITFQRDTICLLKENECIRIS